MPALDPMNSSIGICPVNLNNMGVAVQLLGAQLREHDVPATANGVSETIRTVIGNPHFGFLLLATSNGTPVGVAYVAALLSLEHEGLIGWLEELYVLPENRNRGIGSSLLNAVISRVGELGWKGVELELMAGHERAAAIYTRHGFKRLSRNRFYRLFPSDR